MILSLDTSGSTTSVALYSESADLVSVISENSESHSTKLEQFVRKILDQNKLQPEDLKLILLGAGPGSFTGLRIAFAFAKGLALALKIGICPVSSLQAVAQQFMGKADHILALDDARRGQYFAAEFRTKPAFEREGAEQIVDQNWVKNWQDTQPNSLLVSAYKLTLPEASISTEIVSEQLAVCIGASYFKSRIKPKISKSYLEIANLSPNYIRQVSALSISDRQRMGLLTVK